MQYYHMPCALQRHVHAICSFIDSSGYASGPITICLFIDYIIMLFIVLLSKEGASEPAQMLRFDRAFVAQIQKSMKTDEDRF